MSNAPKQTSHLRALVDRLGRLSSAGEWQIALNPAQGAALSYLARANRFSRAPSNVADYLGTTRGTASQTLKSLASKGLVEEERDPNDRRRLSYSPTRSGLELAQEPRPLDTALGALPPSELSQIADVLEVLLRTALTHSGGKSFGICHSCAHHQKHGSGGYCALLDVQLAPAEIAQICHEHAAA